ncbi:spore germination protein [Marininema halotolerans]|uniref:spore germination protein n=1 Tax=Marininema halotolerans TaxID=1155944 RepID=UPI0015962CFC|nr:spore germination protein [Marininema halotolerans]
MGDRRRHRKKGMAAAWNKQVESERNTEDFVYSSYPDMLRPYSISYYRTLVNHKTLHEVILPILEKAKFYNDETLRKAMPVEEVELTHDVKKAREKLLQGYVLVLLEKGSQAGVLIPAPIKIGRSVTTPEVEFTVLGPKEAFVESLDTNLGLVRHRLPITDLQVHHFEVGANSKTNVAVLYIEGIANQKNVNIVEERIATMHYDEVMDSSFVAQMIADKPNSIFPQLLDTERPDRVAGVLVEGKVVIMVDGSPQALIGPATLMEYFTAVDDYYMPWQIASFFRVIRLVSTFLSFLGSPLYVAVLTYHYELLPTDLMGVLITSRETVPFPPFLEAVVLEWSIELIREAGARLPTKIGLTIGIVGGIVIGTASVEAGLTSNILLIVVAASALSTFTTPIYQMGNTARFIRFPILLMAQLWGLLGVALAFFFLITHLLRLTSLDNPYLEPLYPLRITDFKDSFLRLPFMFQGKRPIQVESENRRRNSGEDASHGGSNE